MLAEWIALSRSEIIVEGWLRMQNSSFVSVRSSVAKSIGMVLLWEHGKYANTH